MKKILKYINVQYVGMSKTISLILISLNYKKSKEITAFEIYSLIINNNNFTNKMRFENFVTSLTATYVCDLHK